MDKHQLQDFLQQHEDAGIAALHTKGYQWFKSEWMPRIRLGEELLPNQTDLLADCWYLIGDVHDFNGAPLQAIQAYQQCLAYDETVDGAYRELAYHYELTGQYPEALAHVQKALADLPPADSDAASEELEDLREELLDLQGSIQDSLNYAIEPFLTANNQAWVLSEQLAREDFKGVIDAVEALEAPSSTLLQRLAQAQGALGDTVAYLQTWQRIAALDDSLEIGYADWFYLPEAVAQQGDFWAALQPIAPRVVALELNAHEDLEDAYGDRLSEAELMALVVQYHHAQSTRNEAGLHALRQQYPDWAI